MDIMGPFTVQVDDYPDTDAELTTPVIRGVITDVVLKHTFDDGSSMDIAITTTGDTLPTEDILGLSGSNTDGWYHVRALIHNPQGAEQADLFTSGISVFDSVNIAVSNAGGGDRLDVWFLVE